MRKQYNVKGNEKKALVKAVSAFTGYESEYLGTPSFAYQIGGYMVDREGALEIPAGINRETVKKLTAVLAEQGFNAEDSVEEAEEKTEPQQIGLTIKLPKETFTPESIENLNNILAAKGALIQKALGLESLPEVEDEGDMVAFPWFKVEPNGVDMVEAYGKLVCALCDMARNQKRVTAKEQHPANEKYAFRCFLLRLGFIGQDCKKVRATLLKNLSGSSSWKDGVKHENA